MVVELARRITQSRAVGCEPVLKRGTLPAIKASKMGDESPKTITFTIFLEMEFGKALLTET